MTNPNQFPPRSALHEPASLRRLQQMVGRVMNMNGGETGQVLGAHGDIWAEVKDTKKGPSGRVTLFDPARYGFPGISTIEIRDVQTATPRYIATPDTSCEETLMEPWDITDPTQQARIAMVVAASVETGTRNFA